MADEFSELTTSPTPATEQPSSAAVSTDTAKAVETTKAETVTVSEAEQTLSKLESLGLTPENAQQVMTKAQLADRISYLVENNPRAFMEEIEKASPETFQKVIDQASDIYLERFGKSEGQTSTKGSDAESPQVEALRKQLQTLQGTIEQDRNQKIFAEKKQQYESKLESFISALPATVTEKDREYLRLKTNKLMTEDTGGFQRVMQGDYLPLAKHFQKASSFLTADTKVAQDQQAQARDKVKASAQPEVPSGPESVVRSSTTDIWGGDEFERDVRSALKKK